MVTKRKRNEAKRMGRLYSGPASTGGSGGGRPGKANAYNPFDYKHGKSRFDFMGKSRKGGQKGGPGAGGKASGSRRVNVVAKHDEGIRKREKSLLVEYKRRHSANTFVDRRFGEHDETLNEEDKAILRFQKERVKQAKRNRYALGEDNLSDDDAFGAEDALTHRGRNLDDFDEGELKGRGGLGGPDDDDGDDDNFGFVSKRSYANDKEFENMMTEFQFGNQNREIASESEDGEVELDEDGNPLERKKRKKSKKEVMQELIAKSKYYKAQKAKEKDEDETLRNKLDTDFRAIMQDQETITKMDELRRRRKEENLRQKRERKPVGDVGYDKITEDLVFEFRQSGAQAQPTREEIARRAKQRLEELEKERIKMMEGREEEEEEDLDQVRGFRGRRLRQKQIKENGGLGDFDEKLRRKQSALEETGDDLGGDFALSEEDGDTGSESDSGSSYYSDESEGSQEEDEGSDDEEEEEEGDGGSGEAEKRKAMESTLKVTGEEAFLRRAGLGAKPNQSKGGQADDPEAATMARMGLQSNIADLDSSIPFVIKIPQTYEDFDQLMAGRAPAQQQEILQRIRISNPVSLGQENRKKAQVFYGILLQYFANLCKRSPLPRKELNLLVPEIHTLTSEVPLYAATVARARLEQMHKRVSRGMWPGKHMVGTLELFVDIFDSQQPRHPVLTPLLLVVAKWLLFTPIRSGVDLARALLLVNLVVKHAKQCKLLVPEAVKFLHSVLKSVRVASEGKGILDLPPKREKKDSRSGKLTAAGAVQAVMDCDVTTRQVETFQTSNFKLSALEHAATALADLCEAYRHLPSLPDLAGPLASTLERLSSNLTKSRPYAKEGKKMTKIHSTIASILRESALAREPLGKTFKESVKPAKQYNPRFEEDYAAGKDYDIDRDRSERKRLRRELKREHRGAVRELRKDNKFLASVKNKEVEERKEDLQRKYNKQFHFLEEQQSDMRSGGQKGTNFLKRLQKK